MAFVSNESETLEVQVTETKEVNEYRIHTIDIRIDPNDPAALRISVEWSKGFVDADSKYVYGRREMRRFTGGPVLSAVTAQVSEGNTRYDEIKKGIWGVLVAEGLVPSGIVK